MARTWEQIISYEYRTYLHTSRWRLSGVKTKEGSQNTGEGVLWLKVVVASGTATVTLYKDDGLAAGDSVATGTATVSGCDDSGANAVEVALTQANTSGLSGSFWIHRADSDQTCPVQVALCTDEDCDALWDACEALAAYDTTNGLAESIRVAGEDVLGRVAARYADELGGYGAAEAWYITDAARSYPDLRRIANPGQLRRACACRALSIAIGRSHQRAEPTAYSAQRDYFDAEYEAALASIILAIKTGSGDDASSSANATVLRMQRA